MKQRLLLTVFSLFFSILSFAQTDSTIRISGNVQDDKKEGLMGASVRVKGTSIGTSTDASGNYTLEVPKTATTLVVSYVGLADQELAIDASKGNHVMNVDMAQNDIALNQVVVSASKKQEKILDAPASISVIGQEKLERNVVTTPVEQLKTTPGVDVMRTGLISSNVVVRGFNNIFSGSVLNVVDNRIGAVPSLRVNAYQLIPSNNLDYERIEVLRGPASALYGPNASSGVVHIITKSPLDQQKKFETTVAMTTGFVVLDKSLQRLPIGRYGNQEFTGNPNPDSIIGYAKKNITRGAIINPELRHSGKLFNGKFGYKISGSYMQAQDYPVYDSREPYDGDSILMGSARNGVVFSPDTVRKFTRDSAGVTLLDSAHLDYRRFQKDFFIRKYTFDGRIDIRPINDITITINGGLAGSHNVELTGLGAAQGGGVGPGWIYWYFQTRFKWKNLYIQYFINSSDAGNTFLIPQLSQSSRNSYNASSPPEAYEVQLLVDKSKLHGMQIQHSYNPLKNLGFVYGIDALLTRPETNGTINGRFEDRDNLNQVGGYLQGDYEPLKWLKLLAAFRVDYNSIIKNVSFSPRAAVVFKPAVGHNIRVTYNRAFDSPTTLNQFLDLSNGYIPNGINVRGIGNPYGWEYNYDDNGVIQFKTAPYESGSGTWVSYNDHSQNATMFNDQLNLIAKGFAASLSGNVTLAQSLLKNILFKGIATDTGTVANAEYISIDYANFAQTKDYEGSKQNVANFQNLSKIDNSFTQTLELGYKGLIASKLSLQVDAYWTRISNYVSALSSASGAVMFDWKTYLGEKDNGILWENVEALKVSSPGFYQAVAGGLNNNPAYTNENIVASDTSTIWDELVVLMNQLPLGTITPDDSSLVGSDYILTYKNLGRLDVFGIDLGFQYNAIENSSHSIMVGGSMSWVNKDKLKLSSGESVSLNAPKVKASVTYDHLLKQSGFGYGLSFRYQMGYEANSSVYFGYVKPAYLLDARVSYRPVIGSYKGLLLSINVNNVANYQWQSFPGTAKMGTQFFARAQVTF